MCQQVKAVHCWVKNSLSKENIMITWVDENIVLGTQNLGSPNIHGYWYRDHTYYPWIHIHYWLHYSILQPFPLSFKHFSFALNLFERVYLYRIKETVYIFSRDSSSKAPFLWLHYSYFDLNPNKDNLIIVSHYDILINFCPNYTVYEL